MPYECDVVTLFPDMFNAITQHGVTGRACEKKLFHLNIWNPRDFTHDNYRTVDDSPYGGGPGMVMKIQPLEDAIVMQKNASNNWALINLRLFTCRHRDKG